MVNFFKKKLSSENVYIRIAATYILFMAIFSPITVSSYFLLPKAYFVAIIPPKVGIYPISYLCPLSRLFYLINYLSQ